MGAFPTRGPRVGFAGEASAGDAGIEMGDGSGAAAKSAKSIVTSQFQMTEVYSECRNYPCPQQASALVSRQRDP